MGEYRIVRQGPDQKVVEVIGYAYLYEGEGIAIQRRIGSPQYAEVDGFVEVV